jgi:(heptosyl)LPS beta-1,4-glucosyltransferase
MGISVVINTKNAAETLPLTLGSVKGWADEIVIVDMKSRDDTLKIAKKYTKNIFEFKDTGFVEPARNFAISKAKQEWVFVLDADEEVSSELKDLIKQVTDGAAVLTRPADAYWIPRKNIIFGKGMEKSGFWPDFQLRLFKKDEVAWSDEIHVDPVVRGKAEYFPVQEELAIIHHHYQSLHQYLERLDRYTTAEVLKSGSTATEQFTPEAVMRVFNAEFFRRVFLDKGIEEGMHGISVSYLQSLYQVVVILKRWEQQGFRKQSSELPQTFESLRTFQKELNYWIADWHIHHTTGVKSIWWRVRRSFRI